MLLVDNFDSFTFNLAHLVRRCGHDVDVVPNTMEVRRDAGEVSHVIISPGPGSPHRARDIGRCHEVLDRYLTVVPVLGVCLGHQVLASHLGAKVTRLPQVRHGIRSRLVRWGESRILPAETGTLAVMRYHSLQVDAATLPDELCVTTVAEDDGAVMSVELRGQHTYGLQFHPESIATPEGPSILAKFLTAT